MKTLGERIVIEQALADGKTIEWSPRGKDWDCRSLLFVSDEQAQTFVFLWRENDYRIKSEPLEFWVIIYNNGWTPVVCTDEESARIAEKFVKNVTKTIKVRQVID